MNCESARDLILESAESPFLAGHIAECVECRGFYQSQRELDRALARHYTPPALTPAFRKGLENKLRRERRQALWDCLPTLVPLTSGTIVTALAAALLPLPPSTVWATGTALTAAACCLQTLITFCFEELEDL